MKTLKTFLNEASLGRVYQHTQGRNIGIISASKGIRSKATEKEKNEQNKKNNENHKKLKADIKKSGFGYIHVRGHYIEGHKTPEARDVKEHSFMVVGKKGHDKGKLLDFLKHHGEKYGQDSILHKKHDEEDAKLHGTSDNFYNGKGGSDSVGKWHPNRAGEFHTVMKGKKFAFESDDGIDRDNLVIEEIKFLDDGVGQGFFRRGKHYDEEEEI